MLMFALLAASPAVRAATFSVTNLADSGTGSLRWAVDQANHSSGADTIEFSISGTIATASPIGITEEVLIAGNDSVTLDATGADPAALIVAAPNVHLRALSVSNTGGAGIIIRGDWCWIDSCHVGPNSGDGIRIENGTHNSITKTVVVASQTGIEIESGFSNEIYGSFIGREVERNAKVGNRGDGIHADGQTDTTFIGGVRAYCTNNCADFVTPQNVIADNAGAGIRIDGGGAHAIWNQIVDNGGDGIVHGIDAVRGEYIDNWIARNGGNGITILGRVDTVLANDGNCNAGMLLDIGGNGPSAKSDPLLDGAPPRPEITDAIRDVASTSVYGTINALPDTTYIVAFHPQSDLCPREGDNFDWNPESVSVNTDASGKASFTAVIGAHTEDSIYATITESGGKKMSEPSATFTVRQSQVAGSDVSLTTSLTIGHSGNDIVLTYTTTVTNAGPAAARDVVVTFGMPSLPLASPTDATGSTVAVGGIAAGGSVVLRQSFLWPLGSGPVRYDARVSHDGGADRDPSNDFASITFPLRRRAAR